MTQIIIGLELMAIMNYVEENIVGFKPSLTSTLT